MCFPSPLVCVSDVDAFARVSVIAADCDYVQVTIGDQTYSKSVPVYSTELQRMNWAQLVCQQIEEVSSLVSIHSLVAWLKDCGFTLNQ